MIVCWCVDVCVVVYVDDGMEEEEKQSMRVMKEWRIMQGAANNSQTVLNGAKTVQ